MTDENTTSLISIVNKDKINLNKFIDFYGEEGKTYVENFIKEHNSMLTDLRKNEALKFISKQFDGNIDIAKSIFNFYIETKLKDEMIENLKDEVFEKNEEINIYKTHTDLENKKLKDSINELYNKRIVSKNNKQKLRLIK